MSSYKSDHTNFDDSRIGSISKGKTTREEVLNLLGQPAVRYHPMLNKEGKETIGYLYGTVRRTGFGTFSQMSTFQKSLYISFDKDGIVSFVEFKQGK